MDSAMDWALMTLIFLCFMSIVCAGIGQYHNWMTYRERMAILAAISQAACRNNRIPLIAYFDRFAAVSYNRHLWYRMTLRDPFQLYQPWYDTLLYDDAVF